MTVKEGHLKSYNSNQIKNPIIAINDKNLFLTKEKGLNALESIVKVHWQLN